jgi:hypothetical protein
MTGNTLLQNLAHTQLDVLSAMHFKAEDWRLITPTTTIKNCFANSGFPSNHVSSNNNALKLTDGEENDWCSLKPFGVRFEDYATHNSALRPEEKGGGGDKATLLDTVKGLEAARKHKGQRKIFPVHETPS